MALFTMTNAQLRFVKLTWADANGGVVTPTADQLTFDSTDETIGKWGMYKADGSPGDASDAGAMAVAGQGVDGSCTVHVVAKNADGSTVTQTADFSVGAGGGGGNITSGTIDFDPAIDKATTASARRR